MVDTQTIGQQAQIAANVGLLNYLIVAIVLFCGALIFFVMYQNAKREERYAKLVEKDLINLEILIRDKMTIMETANKATKEEHSEMITALQKVTATLVQLVFVANVNKKINLEGVQ